MAHKYLGLGISLREPQGRTRMALLLVLWLAAALRWTRPGLVEFKYDEAHVTGLAWDLARGGALPLLSGGTTLGIQRGALDVYLLALPLKLAGGRVEAAVWWLGALGVIAVALTYALGRRVAGPRVGLLAALFTATNPWLVFYDRKLWAHIQVVFSVLLLLLAWQVVVRQRRRAAFWFPVVAALQGLAHTLALVQLLSWVAALLVAPRRWRRREVIAGAAAGGILILPYLGALARLWLARGVDAAWPAPIATSLATALGSIRGAWREAFNLLTGVGINRLALLPSEQSPWWRVVLALAIPVLVLTLLGLLRTLFWARDGAHAPGARLLLAWTVGPTVAFSLGLMSVATQYWTVLLPLPALYLALGLDGVGDRLARWLRPRWAWTGVGAFAVAVALVWTGSHSVLLDAVAAGAGVRAFGVPLSRWQETLTTTRAWAARLGTEEVRVAVDGVDPGYDSEPAAIAPLIGNPPYARFVAPQSPAALLLAYDHSSLYLWTIHDADTEALLGRVGTQVWEQALGADRATARLYTLPPAQTADLGIPLVRLTPEPIFDAGLALLGYAFPPTATAEADTVVTLVWRVLEPAPEVRQRDFTAFNHVLSADGAKVAQVDGLALLSRDWWPGDVLVQRYQILAPQPGAYRWRVGLYSRVDGGRAQVSTGGDYVDLGPLIVR